MSVTKRVCVAILLLVLGPGALGIDSFKVADIRVEGLQRISAGTVFNHLPITVGEQFTKEKSPLAIRALFKTGFFRDVRLEKQGDVLVVVVEERPAIAGIKINGNDDIGTEDLLKALKGIGLSEGKVFNRQVLEKVEQELRRQYFSRGKYGVKIKSEVTPVTRNRVAILISISEGKVAKIKQVNIVGNKEFSDQQLLDQFELSTPNLLSFYLKNDQYSKQKLSADLERLRTFYLDRGYVNFSIESTQVSITPNKKEIYITINVAEGAVFVLNEVKLAGKLIVHPDELIPLVELGPGDVFSRKRATETSKAISERLGDEGYAFANVNMVPDVDEKEKTVNITFFVDPGKRVYVRRINMKGNTKTRDEVLRREMRQMEASWAATSKIERSKTRLDRLGYFEEVNIETPAVPGTSDQIDVNYTVVEKPSGNLQAGFGFSQSQGLIFNASVTQDNVFGSGKRVNFTFNNSDISTIYQIGYVNPYYTVDGISRGFNLGYRQTNADEANVSNFSTDSANAGINFGIPLTEFNRLRANVDLKNTRINTFSDTSDEIDAFVDEEGNSFNILAFGFGWVHDTLNRAIFTTKGGRQSLSALFTIPGIDLSYYKVNYQHRQYYSIAKDLTLFLHGEFAFGDGYGGTDGLPFFEHYFAGGVRSVRGFEDNTLGPRDSRGDSFGGDTKVVGGAELFFPVPFLKDNKAIRMGTFIDFGNVFDSGVDPGDLRYSFGISARWLSPFGALTFSVAQPINKDEDDDVQNFQFSFGAGF